MEWLKKWLNDWRVLVVLVLAIGLSPYVPEPHLLGKIKWLAGGAKGMGLIDWLDFAWHLWPWLLLLNWANKKFTI